MIRNLLATTAIATLVATGAVAQTSTAPTAAPTEPPVEMVVRAEGHLATDLIGKSVYNGTGAEAENIGKVNDLILDDAGDVSAIVVGVGGFLGIGQKEVALEYDLVEWAEQDGDRWLVVETTADALKAQEEFDRSAYRPMPADAEVKETKPATKDDLAKAPVATEEGGESAAVAPAADGTAESTDGMAAAPAPDATAPAEGEQTAGAEAPAPADQETVEAPAATDAAPADQETAQAPATDDTMTPDDTQTSAIDRSTLQEMPVDQVRTEELTGTTVYGANEENIGEIGDVIVSQDGKVDAILVDVGGFLGIGEKEVAIGMDNLAFMTDGNGTLYLYTEFSKEELEQQPAYDEATYADKRDEMRMQVQ
ncbi:PRC-barrel domain-containing protein [Nitratireductor pacificus]|uniref:PRC-barrel protein n=1 Tax=Nitratireductor pacificus pht-3B TaxID=391937 RepID=K2MNE8_9HYPH|nr:PRC-barrel domain-containing protein [Nitratireductor pacificus]EKF18817.1 PRC-barrel protein [Nitratireductor pacificus pht-3B]